MRSDDEAPGRGGGPRFFLEAVVAGLSALVAAALLLGAFDDGLPKPARAEAAAPVVLAGGGGPVRPLVQLSAWACASMAPGVNSSTSHPPGSTAVS